MRPFILKLNLSIWPALALVLCGCSHPMNSAKTNPAPMNPPAAQNQYTQKIVELKNVVQQNSNAAGTKKAHLELAHLYSNHKNPQRNYPKALEHLRTYLMMEDATINGEMLNWMAAFKEIERLSAEIARLSEEIAKTRTELENSNQATLALQKTNQKLTREEIKLREKNRTLEESNQKLEKTIEMLKNLDQRLEEKRRNFTN